VAQEKGNEDLMQWAAAVKNHFWYCSRHCEGNIDDFKVLYCTISLSHYNFS
jgi:hypothetical protein